MPSTPDPSVEEDSFFDLISRQIEEREAEQKDFDLDVPNWEKFGMTVTLTFRPISADELAEAQKAAIKASKQSKKGSALRANTDLIIDACLGVRVNAQGQVKEFKGFGDADLNKLFRSKEPNATATVKAVFGLDGYIVSTADALIEKSGFQNQQIRDQIEGE